MTEWFEIVTYVVESFESDEGMLFHCQMKGSDGSRLNFTLTKDDVWKSLAIVNDSVDPHYSVHIT